MQEEFLPAYEEELLFLSRELNSINDELRKRTRAMTHLAPHQPSDTLCCAHGQAAPQG